MTIAHVVSTAIQAATGARGTASSVVAYPAGVAAGRLAILVVNLRPSTSNFTADPAGWTPLVNQTGGGGTFGLDTGPSRLGIWYRILDGTESGNVTVSSTSVTNINMSGAMSIYSKTQANWTTPIATVGSDSTAGTNVSAAMAAWASTLAANDFVYVAYANNTDNTTAPTSPTLTQSGATFSALTNRVRILNSDGNDGSVYAYEASVTTGTANAPTFALTWTVTSSGPVAAIRLRENNTILPNAVRFDADGEDLLGTFTATAVPNRTIAFWGKLAVDRNNFSAFVTLDDGTTAPLGVIETGANGTTVSYFENLFSNEATLFANLTVGTWYYIALTVASGTATLKVRPSGSATWTTTSSAGFLASPTVSRINIGESGAFGAEWLNGSVAAVKVWSAVLTETELNAEYASRNPVRTSNLLLAYGLDGISDLTSDGGIGSTLTGSGAATDTSGPPEIASSATTINGDAALTAQTSLTVAGVVTKNGVAVLTGQTALTVAGVLTKNGVALLTGQTSLGVAGSATTTASASLTAQTSLVAAGARIVDGTSALTIQSNLVAAGNVSIPGAAVMSGQTVLTVTGRATTSGAWALTSQTVLSANGTATVPASVSLTVQSNMVSAGVRTVNGQAVLSGQSTFISAGTVSKSGSAAFTSQTGLTVTGVANTNGTSAQSAQTTLTVSGVVSKVGSSTLTSQTSLTANTSVSTTAIVALSGQTNLTTSAIATALTGAAFTAQTSLVAAGVIGALPVSATLSADSTLVINGRAIAFGIVVLSGQTNLVANTRAIQNASAVFTAQTNIIALNVVTKFGVTTLTAQSSLGATGDIGSTPSGANLTAQSNMSIAGSITALANVALTAQTSFVATLKASTFAATTLSAQSTLISSLIQTRFGSVSLRVESNIITCGYIAQVYLGSATLTIQSQISIDGSTNPPWVFPFIELMGTHGAGIEIRYRTVTMDSDVRPVIGTETSSRITSMEGK